MPSNTGGKAAADQEMIELQRALLSAPTTGVPATGDPEARKAYLGRRAAQREAYGQFVANQEIYDPDGSALIFAAGMPVPLEHVERFGLEETGMVDRIASPELARKGARFGEDEQPAEPRTIAASVAESATAVDTSAEHIHVSARRAGK